MVGKKSRRKRRDWRPRAVGAVLVGAQMVIGAITVQDIRRRPPDLVRGPRLFWMVWGGTNMLGSAVYWVLARRRTPATAASAAGAARGG